MRPELGTIVASSSSRPVGTRSRDNENALRSLKTMPQSPSALYTGRIEFDGDIQPAKRVVQHGANHIPCELARATAQRRNRQRRDAPHVIMRLQVRQPGDDILQLRGGPPVALGRE